MLVDRPIKWCIAQLHLHYFTEPKIKLHDFTLTFAQSVNKFHYVIFIYAECKCQTIYTHNIGYNLHHKPQRRKH